MAATDPQPESRIFISYRREDSSGHVLALLPALRAQFGANRIFKDTDNIPAGVDFVKFIKHELETCAVLLAIIGRDWLTVQDPRLKRRRLDNPEDFLRVEVATALKNERIRVIPVLVERGMMPTVEDLPPDLAALAHRNAIELSDVRWESDVKRLIEAIQRAAAAAVEKPPEPVAAQRPDLQNLQKRRAREIATHVAAARDAVDAKDYETALWACEKALLIDPQNAEALELLDRARKAIDQQKIDGWLNEARTSLSESDLANASDLIDQALSLEPTSADGLSLRQELLKLRREREQNRERQRQADAAIARARASEEEEDFESAIRHAEDALALAPDSVDAQNIRSKALATIEERRRQREHKRRAQQAVTDARARFAAGETEAGLRLLRDFTPSHELVSNALQELQKEVDELDRRERQVKDLLEAARADIAAGRFSEAVTRLSELARTNPDRDDVAPLLNEAQAGIAAAAAAEAGRRAADATLAEASKQFQQRDYLAARRSIEDAGNQDPTHPELVRWVTRVERAIAEQAAAAERAEALHAAIASAVTSLEKGELESAIRHAAAALAIDPAHAEAKRLRETAEAAIAERLAREEHERAAAEIVARARRMFKAEDHRAALNLLERFTPAHALVTETLAELRRELDAIETRRREQEEESARLRRQREEEAARLRHQQEEEAARKRREAERAAAERKRAETIQRLLARGRASLEREDFDAAIRDADELLQIEAGLPDAVQLRKAATDAQQLWRKRQEEERLAREAAEKARAEAARLAEQRRQEEARARAREEAERRQKALAAAVSAVEGHLAAGRVDEAERAIAQTDHTIAGAPEIAALQQRLVTLREQEAARAREARIQELLADAQAALAAREFKSAKSKARAVLEIAPANEAAQSILSSVRREVRAERLDVLRTRAVRPAAIAAVILSAVGGIWYYSQLPAPETQPSVSTPAPAPTLPPPSKPAQTPVQTPVQPPAETAATAKPPEPKGPTPEETLAKNLEPLRARARDLYRSGQRVQALETATEGLKLAPDDPALQALIDSLLAEALKRAQGAKTAAVNAGAAAPAQPAFTEGVKLEDDAKGHQSANRKPQAIRTLWGASEKFVVARGQAIEYATQQAKIAEDAKTKQKQLADEQARQKQQADEQARLKQGKENQNQQKPSAPTPPPREETKTAEGRGTPPVTDKPLGGGTPKPTGVNRAEEQRRVEGVMRRLEAGYDNLKAAEIRAVFPSQPDLTKRFADFRSYDLTIDIQNVNVSADATSATVLARVVHSFRGKVGGTQTGQPQMQLFTLQKQGNEWIIVQAQRQ